MRFTKRQYETAIESLQDGMTQLEPDRNPCAVCGDSGHMAFECGHNPLVAMALCQMIRDSSRDLHEMLHWLAGENINFGVQIGFSKVVLPEE